MAAGQAPGFAWTVGDVQNRHAGFAVYTLEQPAHLTVQLLIERGQRFVEAQHRRPMRQRTTKRDALRLTAAELVRHAVEQADNPE